MTSALDRELKSRLRQEIDELGVLSPLLHEIYDMAVVKDEATTQLAMCRKLLDDLKVPRASKTGIEFSLYGRIQFLIRVIKGVLLEEEAG